MSRLGPKLPLVSRPGSEISGIAWDAGYDPSDVSENERAILRRAAERHRQKVSQERDEQLRWIAKLPDISKRVVEARKALGWTREKLCVEAGISYGTCRQLERYGKRMSRRTLEKVFRALNFNLAELADEAKRLG